MKDPGSLTRGPILGLPHLVEVNLGRHDLTDASLVHFAGMSDLEKLDLAQNERIVSPDVVHLRGPGPVEGTRSQRYGG